MGCIRSLSRIWGEWPARGILVVYLLLPAGVYAAFVSQFSLTAGEEYNDNIFFTKNKTDDFITIITPTLSILYTPQGQGEPTLNLNVSPSVQIFAEHRELNDFRLGENLSSSTGYTYQYSPRLNFHLSDTFRHSGRARTVGLGGGLFQQPGPVTSPPPPGGIVPPPVSQNLNNFISGNSLSNFFSLQGSYLYAPDIRFNGGYSNTITNFIDAGGTDVFHTISARGVYNWRQDHNLHAGYSLSIFNARNGQSGVVHGFDIGDDYFSNYNLQLSPTLSLTASTGLSINTGSRGPRIANNSNATITKLWQTATLNAGVQKGFTPSFGVSGISDTTTFSTNFIMRLTEKLSLTSGAGFSLYDTSNVNFKTFQGNFGLQYPITTWLSSSLAYNFRWIDSGSGATRTALLRNGTVTGNTVFLSLTANFELWPNPGLARTLSYSTASALRPPFPLAPPTPTP